VTDSRLRAFSSRPHPVADGIADRLCGCRDNSHLATGDYPGGRLPDMDAVQQAPQQHDI